MDAQYCVSKCEKNEKVAILDKLHQLSQLTWVQLHQSPKHSYGYEKIPRNAIKRPVPSQITEDVTLIAFRFHGKAAMVGYREHEIFHIIWFDRDFSLYNHG